MATLDATTDAPVFSNKAPLNIVLVQTDQLRRDYVGWTPYSRCATPNMDRIARQGAAFNACVTVNPISQPARAAMLTGRYTHQVGLLDMSGDLEPRHPTFPRALQRAGWHTVTVGKLHYWQWPWKTPDGQGHRLVDEDDAFRAYGFDEVWQACGKQLITRDYCHYARHLERHGLLDAYREYAGRQHGGTPATPEGMVFDGRAFPFAEEHYIDRVIGAEARRRLETMPADKPFFLQVSFCGPHPPFDPPARFLDATPRETADDFLPGEKPLTPAQKEQLRDLRRAYRAMIACVDEEVGRLLDLLEKRGLAGNTAVLFTSDHGEMLGDHYAMQKSVPWRASIEVPLAIRVPGAPAGITCDTPVETIDIAATILELAGLDAWESLSLQWPVFNNRVPSTSLLPIVRGGATAVRETSFSECRGEWSMVQDGRWKLTRWHARPNGVRAREELFDLKNDPDEQRNLRADPACAAIAARLREALLETLERTPPGQSAPFSSRLPCLQKTPPPKQAAAE
jgi:choline-sulfatase